jgi:CheY-like chemotaxis protein
MTTERNIRVLVADDDPEAAAVLVQYLKRAGVSSSQVTVVNRGDLAMAALDDNPDLAIVDLTMPRVSGADVVREAQRRGIPAHLVTTRTPLSKADAKECRPKTALPMLTSQWVFDACFRKMEQKARKKANNTGSWWSSAVSTLWGAM